MGSPKPACSPLSLERLPGRCIVRHERRMIRLLRRLLALLVYLLALALALIGPFGFPMWVFGV